MAQTQEFRLRLKVIGRGKQVLQDLFQSAFERHEKRNKVRTEVYVAQPSEQVENTCWRRLEPRRCRPMDTIVATSDPGPEKLLEDMREFWSRESWYIERGVPFRRGYLFHGPPGCGKTSFVTAAASELKCPIYVLNLAEASLTDLGLLKLVTDAQPRSILLIEDVDAAFHGAKGGVEGGSREKKGQGKLTFSGLLNAIDGVAGQEGKLMVLTTNHPQILDAALVRPGRVDMRATFSNAPRSAIETMFRNFFRGSVDDIILNEAAAKFGEKCPENKLSMAAVQGHLLQFANHKNGCELAANADPPEPSQDEPVKRQFALSTPASEEPPRRGKGKGKGWGVPRDDE